MVTAIPYHVFWMKKKAAQYQVLTKSYISVLSATSAHNYALVRHC
jgi:hypothetical protein